MRLLFTILLIVAPAASAWQLQIGSVHSAALSAQTLSAERAGDQLKVSIARLQLPDLQIDQSDIVLTCALQSDRSTATLCAAAITARQPKWQGTLHVASSVASTDTTLRIGKARLRWQIPAASAADTGQRFQLQRVPLAWLQSRLSKAWPELASLAGTADADLLLDHAAPTLSGEVMLNDLAFDSTLGDVAGSALNLHGNISVGLGQRPSVDWRVDRPSGQLLFDSIYFELPAATSALQIAAAVDAAGVWQLPMLHWQDGEGLTFKVAAQFDAGGGSDIDVLDFRAELGALCKRYLGTALATVGFDGLQLHGDAAGKGRFVAGAWQSFELDLNHLRIEDPSARIAVAEVDGRLRMDQSAAMNSLSWKQARLFQIPLGNGVARWRWSPEQWQLAEPLSIALLGGSLRIPELKRRRIDGVADWQGSIELDQLDVLNLTTALALPHFTGTLSGRLPGFHFRNGGFSTEGDIQLTVFDGQMRVSAMSSERTFGVAPSLSADIGFDNLDLKQLSSVLDFGEIEGWLDGDVSGLRMLDWAPVAFDAHLRTDSVYPGKRRISQRAVQGLSSVGGGGAVGNPLMKLVDSFPYAQIGLNCRLADNVCAMSGLEPNGSGYTILRGASLPRLTVVGHQKQVDWPVLLARLQAASAGQAPVID